MMKYLLGILAGAVFMVGGVALAAPSVFITQQGGTGTSSPSGILYGDNGATSHLNTVTIGAGCSFSGGTLTCTGTGSAFPFTPQTWGNSTSTTLGFLNGFISAASSTISYLGIGSVYTDAGGRLFSQSTTSVSGAYQSVWRDVNQSAFAQNFVSAATTFPTNGATVTLTAASPRTWVFTGTLAQTMKLPSGLTLSTGATFQANDNSTGQITIVDNGNNILTVVPSGGSRYITIYDTSTANGQWDSHGFLGHQVNSGYNNLGVGSSSPAASLTVHANPNDTNIFTNLFVIGSSTVSATTTLFTINNIGSTTLNLFGSCSGSNALTTTASGLISCGAITGSFSFPFTPTTNYNQAANATTTALWFQATGQSLMASTSVSFGSGNSGNSYFSWDGTNNKLGLGTTSPWGLMSINGNLLATNVPQFVIGSSSATNFIVTSGGKIGIGTTTPFAKFTLGRNGLGIGFASSSIVVESYRFDGQQGRQGTSTNARLDCRTANTLVWPIGAAATTLSLDGLVSGSICKVVVQNPNGAPGTITWVLPSGFTMAWFGGTAPTQTATANSTDVFVFQSVTGSSTMSILGGMNANYR